MYSDTESAILAQFDAEQQKFELEFASTARSPRKRQEGVAASAGVKTVTIAPGAGAEVEVIHYDVPDPRSSAQHCVSSPATPRAQVAHTAGAAVRKRPLWSQLSARSGSQSPQRVSTVTALAKLVGGSDTRGEASACEHAEHDQDELELSIQENARTRRGLAGSGTTMTKKEFSDTFLVSSHSGRKLQSYSMFLVEELINVKDR